MSQLAMLVSIRKSLEARENKLLLSHIPWTNIATNLNGLWKVKTRGRDLIVKGLTVNNLPTTLREILHVDDSMSKQVTLHFEILGLQDT
jgi:hypothetical protein